MLQDLQEAEKVQNYRASTTACSLCSYATTDKASLYLRSRLHAWNLWCASPPPTQEIFTFWQTLVPPWPKKLLISWSSRLGGRWLVHMTSANCLDFYRVAQFDASLTFQPVPWKPFSSFIEDVRYAFRLNTTTSQNKLWSRFGKLFFPSSPDVPALLPSAMLPRQARGTRKKTVYQTYCTVHFGT